MMSDGAQPGDYDLEQDGFLEPRQPDATHPYCGRIGGCAGFGGVRPDRRIRLATDATRQLRCSCTGGINLAAHLPGRFGYCIGIQQSRAVVRTVDAGNSAYCATCGELIKFRARVRANQIICNVYVKNKWDRVEHFHAECYKLAKQPFGEPLD